MISYDKRRAKARRGKKIIIIGKNKKNQQIFSKSWVSISINKNVSQYHDYMNRTFHDFLTRLTSTEKLLTWAGFGLAPSGTLVSSCVSEVDSEIELYTTAIVSILKIFVLYIRFYILYTVYCILYTVYCILYTVYCVLYTVYCILHVYCISYMYALPVIEDIWYMLYDIWYML